MSLRTPEKIRRLQIRLYVKAKEQPEFRFYSLYDKVFREDILDHAWRLSRANRGQPGVDGVTFADIEAQGVQEWLAALEEELRTETYRPAPVRRVMIPKPGGGERPLGIPTVRDRVVQTAAKLVLEPIYEADFLDCAYGYRPRRSAKDAVRAVRSSLRHGYTSVVDADLSKYFDTIPHSELMRSMARRVVDRKILRLIKRWLKTPVEVEMSPGKCCMSGGKESKLGTPQGGVISPLLANVYMHRYLRFWRLKGRDQEFQARIVNYADDFVILSKNAEGAKAALAWTRTVLELVGLTLNEDKTCLRHAPSETFDFLGYTFGPTWNRGSRELYLGATPSRKSVSRAKEKFRGVLRPGNMLPMAEIVAKLNRMLTGWANYFDYGATCRPYRAVNEFVANRVRTFLRRRCKVRTRATKRYPIEKIHELFGIVRLGRRKL